MSENTGPGWVRVPLGWVDLSDGRLLNQGKQPILGPDGKQIALPGRLRKLLNHIHRKGQNGLLVSDAMALLGVEEGTLRNQLTALRNLLADNEASFVRSKKGSRGNPPRIMLVQLPEDSSVNWKNIIAEAEQSENLNESVQQFQMAADGCPDPKRRSFAATNLAVREADPAKRLERRKQAINEVERDIDTNPQHAVAFASSVVDLFADFHARGPDRSGQRQQLRRAEAVLRAHLTTELDSRTRSSVNGELASVIRCQLKYDKSKGGESQRLRELLDIAFGLRIRIFDDDTTCAIAQAWMDVSQHKDFDGPRVPLANRAEMLLVRKQRGFARLVLARRYGLSGRPLSAAITFQQFSRFEEHRTWPRHEAFLLGDSALNAWQRYPGHPLTKGFLEQSSLLLDDSINSGFVTAASIIVAATVCARRNEPGRAAALMSKLAPRSGGKWSHLVDEVERTQKAHQADLLRTVFSVGMTDATSWVRLGTYAGDIGNDWRLARRCYEIARSLEPDRWVPWNNLARADVLLASEVGKEERALMLARAGESLRITLTKAPANWQWWRTTYSMYLEACNAAGVRPEFRIDIPVNRPPTLEDIVSGKLGIFETRSISEDSIDVALAYGRLRLVREGETLRIYGRETVEEVPWRALVTSMAEGTPIAGFLDQFVIRHVDQHPLLWTRDEEEAQFSLR